MKGQTTNEVRAKIPGGNHCDQDLIDAMDEIDALQARINAMLVMVENIRVEYLSGDDDEDGFPTIELSRFGLGRLLDSIRYAGKGDHDADAERGVD